MRRKVATISVTLWEDALPPHVVPSRRPTHDEVRAQHALVAQEEERQRQVAMGNVAAIEQALRGIPLSGSTMEIVSHDIWRGERTA